MSKPPNKRVKPAALKPLVLVEAQVRRGLRADRWTDEGRINDLSERKPDLSDRAHLDD